MNEEYSLSTRLTDLNGSSAEGTVGMLKTTDNNNAWDLTGGQVVNTIYPYVERWYPNYVPYWSEPSKIDKAFKLVQRLMEKKLIKEPKTVKDFIEIVNVLAEEL